MRVSRSIPKTLRHVFTALVHYTPIIPLATLSFLGASSPTPLAAAPVPVSRASPVQSHPLTQAVAAPQDTIDPYGDSASYSGLLCSGTSTNATGAPDTAVATLTGLGCTLTVSFDASQSRTGNLVIYLQNTLSLGTLSSIEILSGTDVLQTVPNTIDLSLVGTQSTTLLYTGTVPYTGIRFSALIGANYGVDAVEELPDPPLPPDAYGDAAQIAGTTCPSLLGSSGNSATGGPDGNTATLGVGVDCTLLLDMGKGEEGLGDLTIYFSGTAHVGAQVTVSLLDSSGNVLTSTNNALDLSLTPGPQTTTLTYSGTVPYRYVSFSNLANLGLLTSAGIVDAVQAQYYNGSDSDGDGIITNCPTPALGQECAGDADSDGILDYLDNDSLDNAQTEKLVSATSVHTGSPVTFEIVLHNAGVVTLTPTITDVVPAPLQIDSSVPAAMQTGNTLVWPDVEVPPGEIITLTVVASGPFSGTLPYTVTNQFVGGLPAAFSFNQLPARSAPTLTVSPYTYYMPIAMND